MAFQTSRLLRHVTYWLLTHRHKGLQIDAAVLEFRKGVRALAADIVHVLSGSDREHFERIRQEHIAAGAPAELAARIAGVNAQNAALDIVEIAASHRVGVTEAARIYFGIGTHLGIDWLREQIEQLAVEGPWQAIARTGLRDAGMRIHRRLAERVLSRTTQGSAAQRVEAWIAAAGAELAHWQRTLADMRASKANDFASLTVGVEAVRKLAD